MIDEQLHEKIESISQMIMGWDGVIQIGYSSHADALIAAAIFGKTFIDLDRPFVLYHHDQGPHEESIRKGYSTILIDINMEGTKDISGDDYVVLLRGGPSSSNDQGTYLDIEGYEYAPDEISFSVVTYFICLAFALDKTLPTLIQMPLISTQVHKMYSEYTGLHKIIVDDAEETGVIQLSKQFAVLGGDIFGITNALVYSGQPFNPGLTGNETEVTKLLAKAGITVDTREGERKITDLSKEELTSLISTISVHMGAKREYQEKFELLKFKTNLVWEEDNSILKNTWDYARAIQDCIHRDRIKTVLAVLLGNRGEQYQAMTRIFKEERRALSMSFQIIKDKQDEVEDLSKIRYLVTNHKINWYNTSMAAAMGLSSGLVIPDLPFAIVAEGPKDLYTIGMRASTTHKLEQPLKEVVESILTTRGVSATVHGSDLSILVSVPQEEYEPILLAINTKLME